MTNVRHTTPYDPRTTPDFSPMKIEGYAILRRRLTGTPMTRYCVMANGALIGYQVSYPTAEDCRTMERAAIANHRVRSDVVPVYAQAGASLTERIIVLLKLEKMQLQTLGQTLKHNPNIISPILARLCRDGRITRSGRAGQYTYSA